MDATKVEKSDAECLAGDLFDRQSNHLLVRAEQLLRTKKIVGHSFAFWMCGDYYGTKQKDGSIRVFHAPAGNSHKSKSRLVAELHDTTPEEIVAAIRADVG